MNVLGSTDGHQLETVEYAPLFLIKAKAHPDKKE